MMDYEKQMAHSAVALRPSGIRQFFSLAAEKKDVISLGVGEPDFKTPWAIRKAAIDSLDRGRTWYTANAGLAELQGEIVAYLRRRFGLEYAPEEVLVTVGGSEAIDLSIRTFVNPGDEVLIPQPSFVCYEPIVQLTGGVAVPIVTREEDEFRLTAKALRAAITPKTKALVFPFPNNPTGGVMRREDLEAVAAVLRDTELMVFADEIYAELTYGEKHISIASLEGMQERTVLISGFSKTFAMTGWRLGYLAAPKEVTDVMCKVHQYAIMCAPTTSQYAAIEALRSCEEAVGEMVGEYNLRRRLVVSRLNEMGLHCFNPQGAFYVFPSIQSTGLTSQQFCERLLYEKNVAVVPGDAFGACGEGFVRISYSYSVEHLREALGRIEAFIKGL